MRLAKPFQLVMKLAVVPASILSLASLANCSNDGGTTGTPATNEPVITEIRNTQPTGTVSGRVYDFSTGAPMAGVSVVVTAGAPLTAVLTLEDGSFTVPSVPAGGNVNVAFSMTGFHGASVTAVLGNAAGNFPSQNSSLFVGPVGLLANSGGPVKVTVLLPNGQPASGASLFLDLPAAWLVDDANGSPVLRGNIHETATSDPQGAATFNSLPPPAVLATRFPALAVNITVAAFAGTPATGPQANGTTQSLTLSSLVQNSNQLTVVLPAPGTSTALKVLASNVPDLISDRTVQVPGEIAVSTVDTPTPVRLVFNQPILPAQLETVMVSEDGSPLNPNGELTRLKVRVPGAAGGADGGVSAEPASVVELLMPRTLPGIETNLFFRATALGGGSSLTVAAPVYVAPSAALAVRSVVEVTQAIADGRLGAGETVDIFLNQPIGARDANGTAVGTNAFLPVLITFSEIPLSVVGTASLSEPSPRSPHRQGGFTTRIRATIPSGDLGMETFSNAGLGIRLEFNDSARRDGGPMGGGTATVVTPSGVPVTVVESSSVPVTLLDSDMMP